MVRTAPAPRNQRLQLLTRGSTVLTTPGEAVVLGGWWLGPGIAIGSQLAWPTSRVEQIRVMRELSRLRLHYPLDPATPQTWGDQEWGQRCFTLHGQRLELVSTWGLKGPTGETLKRMTGFRPEWLIWISPEHYAEGLAPWLARGYVEEEHPYGDAGWYGMMLGKAPRPGWLPVPYCIVAGNKLYRQSYLARVDIPAYRAWAAKQVREAARVCCSDAIHVGVKWHIFENPQLLEATVWPNVIHRNFYAPGAFVSGINAFLRELAAGDPPLYAMTNTIASTSAAGLWDWVEPTTLHLLIAEGA